MPLDGALLAAIAAALIGGMVRGYAGFGAGLIFIPVASAAFGPRVAAPVLMVADFVLTLPMLVAALSACRWKTVLPAALAALAVAPVGAWFLLNGDPTALRWVISGVVLLLLGLIASGLRYHGEPRAVTSAGVGAVAGFLGGFSQLSGPPMIAYWISGPYPAPVIRANMIVFFALVTVSSFTVYVWNGLFTDEVFGVLVFVAPAYGIALLAGTRIFKFAGGGAYRQLAYGLVAIAAVTSLPLFDAVLR